MMNDPTPSFEHYFLKYLAEEKALLENTILSGGCADFVAYREVVGRRHGLVVAENHFIELVKKWHDQ